MQSSCSSSSFGPTPADRAMAIAEQPDAAPINDWTDRPGAAGRTWPSEALLRLICRYSRPAERALQTALDAGCGNGRHAVALAQLGFGRVLAVDALPQFLNICQANAAAQGQRVETRPGALHELPLDAGEIHLAVAWGVLFQLGGAPQTTAALQELHRVLRPGGLLISDWRTQEDGLLPYADKRVAPHTFCLSEAAPAGLARMVYSFWDAEQVAAFHVDGGFEVRALERIEVRDVLADTSYSWWTVCAQRSKN